MADAGVRAAGTSRLEMVDALRGYALMGLFLVHMAEYFELYWASPKPTLTTEIVFGLFMGKTFSLLALCFGFSFYVMMEGGRRRGRPFAGRFAWRLVLLALIGFAHSLLYRGDIILVLAAIGFLLIPFDYVRSNRLLLAAAAFCFAQPYLWIWVAGSYVGASWAAQPPLSEADPAMQVYLTGGFGEVLHANLTDGQANKWAFFINTGRCAQVLGLFLIGLVLGRTNFFVDLGRFRRGRAVALVASIAMMVGLYLVRMQTSKAAAGPAHWLDSILGGWQNLAAMAMSVLLFILAWRVGADRLLRLLVPAGRMTLSLYIGQSLLFVPLFYAFGAGLYATIGQGPSLLLGIVAFVVQVAAAGWWFRHFHYGPLEWLWRCGTRTSLAIPFRRHAAPELVSA